MRSATAFLLLALCACGGGGASDPVTHVTLVDSIDGVAVGKAHWDSDGTYIQIVAHVLNRTAVLEHEIWHLLTRYKDHVNESPCVSRPGSLVPAPEMPCPDEIEQVLERRQKILLSFPEDMASAFAAKHFWNDALGYEAVVVVVVE